MRATWGLVWLAAAALSGASQALAQNRYFPIPPANSTQLPPGISIKRTPIGDVYVDAQGRTLYGMDYRTLVLDMRNPASFCTETCAEVWEAVVPPAGTPPTPALQAPAGAGGGLGQLQGQGQGTQAARGGGQAQGANQAQNAGAILRGFASFATGPDWTVTQGASGPQLLYKRTNLVFVRKDAPPGSTQWDGADDFRWNVLRYIPPVPKVTAPPNVVALFVDGAYAFADASEHVLYVQDKQRKCRAACERPMPFRAGAVSHGIGDWSVSRAGDFPQWLYRGSPVFVSQSAPKSADIPAGATILRP